VLDPRAFIEAFQPTDASSPLRLQESLRAAFPSKGVVATSSLDLDDYEELGYCTTRIVAEPLPLLQEEWGGVEHDALSPELEMGLLEVSTSEGTHFLVAQATWPLTYSNREMSWVIADTVEAAKALILDVARKTNAPREALLVFHGGCWQKSRDLYEATQRASFDTLVLEPGLKERIRADFSEFLRARAAYEELGLSWRRGALFLGPPGNGKTHCLRALVKALAIPSLYVQSIRAQYRPDEANLQAVFKRARQLRPCVLIFEDVDTLITPRNRSFFLNQLDGFEKNVGMITIATTNHPERLDPALIDRPSRFDRKYHFNLPDAGQRREYLGLWALRLGQRAALGEPDLDALAEAPHGFSFAYLQELIVSSLLRQLERPAQALIEHLRGEMLELRKQMESRPLTACSASADDLEQAWEED